LGSLTNSQSECVFDTQPRQCGTCGACEKDCYDFDKNCFTRNKCDDNPCNTNNGGCPVNKECQRFCGCRVRCKDRAYGSGAYRYGIMMGIGFVMGIFVWM